MKVYELMTKLSKYESGMEVSINCSITVPQLEACVELDEDENGDMIYSVSGKCDDIDGDPDGVVLYF